jgi:hypothetical protein
MKQFRSRVAIFLGGACLLAALPSPGAAADIVGDLMDHTRDVVESAWYSLTSPFSGSSAEAIAPPTAAHAMGEPQSGSFWEDLSDAGYELVDIDTVVGVIPDVKLSYQLVRELSDADRDFIERKLEVADNREPGILPYLQRRIIQSLLAASDMTDMHVTKLVVGVLPLPTAEFKLEPRDAHMSPDHDVLYRALLNKPSNRAPVTDAGVPDAPQSP